VVLAEKKLSYAGLTLERTSVELGRLSSATLAVFGVVSKEGEDYLITARVVEVSSGEILRSVSVTAQDEYFFRPAARKAATALFP
jgi:hypothetical protein